MLCIDEWLLSSRDKVILLLWQLQLWITAASSSQYDFTSYVCIAVLSPFCCRCLLYVLSDTFHPWLDWRIHTLSSTSSRGKPQRRALSQCSPRTVLTSHSPSWFVFPLTRANTTDCTYTSSRCHATFSARTLLFVSTFLMLCTYTSNFALTYLHCIH